MVRMSDGPKTAAGSRATLRGCGKGPINLPIGSGEQVGLKRVDSGPTVANDRLGIMDRNRARASSPLRHSRIKQPTAPRGASSVRSIYERLSIHASEESAPI